MKLRLTGITAALLGSLISLEPAAAENKFEAFDLFLESECPKPGGAALAGMLSDPLRAAAFGKLNYRKAEGLASDYAMLTLTDDPKGPTPEKRKAANALLVSMGNAVSGWFLTIWSVTQAQPAEFAPSQDGPHPAQAIADGIAQFATLTDGVSSDPAAQAVFAPIERRIWHCGATAQNQVALQNVDTIRSTQYSEQLFERYAVITPSFSAEGVSPPAEIEAVFGSSFRAPPAPIFGANETGLDKILAGLRSGNYLGPNNAGPDFIVSATPEPPKPAPKPVKPQPKPEPKPVVNANAPGVVADKLMQAFRSGNSSAAQALMTPDAYLQTQKQGIHRGSSRVFSNMRKLFARGPRISGASGTDAAVQVYNASIQGRRFSINIYVQNGLVTKIITK